MHFIAFIQNPYFPSKRKWRLTWQCSLFCLGLNCDSKQSVADCSHLFCRIFLFLHAIVTATNGSPKEPAPYKDPTRSTIFHRVIYLVVWVQRYIVRIIFMVPVYSVMSFFSLLFENASVYFDTVRDWWAPERLPRRDVTVRRYHVLK